MKKKKFTCKLIAIAFSACLIAQSLAYLSPAEVFAGEVQEEYADDTDIQDADMPQEEESAQEVDVETESGEAAGDSSADEALPDEPIQEKTKEKVITAKETVQSPEGEEEKKISFEDAEKILIEIKITKSKVNDDPKDGAFYYKGSNMRPQILVYTLSKVEEGEDISGVQPDLLYKNDKDEIFIKKELTKGTDYTVTYPKDCEALGKYELTVSAAAKSEKYEGSRKVPYEVVEEAHKWSDWKVIVQQNVFQAGKKQRTCSVCKRIDTVVLAKLKPTIKINMTTIPLKVKKTTTKFKVSGLALGDSVKSYKSSNKKIFTVDKKGKIKAKKKGTAKLTVTLASGKKATAKVKVQKGTVKTTKVTVNTSKLVLLKGGSYTLRTTLAPLTTQQKATYSSSNKKVVTVSSKGVLNAKKKGTAKITVKSGSKKKQISVTVNVPSFPKGDGNAFLKSCQKIANTIMTDGNWIYFSGVGMKKSFAEARDYNPRQTSCANYVNFCMQDFGTLEPGMAFYGDGKGKIVYQGSSSKKAATKAMVEKNYDIIKLGGKKAVNAGLQPGDICIYKGHTNVFACLNSEGVPVWYDAGRNSTSDGKPESGYFTNMYRASYYNSMPIYYVLRLKK
jgi:Bacterial surface proteins containing Ig-like domains